MFRALLCLALVHCGCLGATVVHPRHVHLFYTGDETRMGVDYITSACDGTTEVKYGEKEMTKTVHGSSLHMTDVGCLRSAVMVGLKQNTVYKYAPGVSGGSFDVSFDFHNYPTFRRPVFGMLADLGLKNDQSVPHLKANIQNKSIDYLLHAGDFAYNFETNKSAYGNKFMDVMQPITAHVAYQVAPGNHEEWHNFTQYKNRFRGIGANTKSGTSLYWSFNVDLIHFLVIDTETWAEFPNKGLQQSMINFIRADLEEANKPENRAKQPWIVAFGHKGFWMANWTEIEPILHEYGVDLYLTGHIHNYERLAPIWARGHLGMYHASVDNASVSTDGHTYTNPKYMTTIVAGAAGCQEHLSSSCGPKPTKKHPASSYIKRCWREYGMGYLQAPNRTHLHWWWVEVGKKDGKVTMPPVDDDMFQWEKRGGRLDYLWIVQNKHQKRQLD